MLSLLVVDHLKHRMSLLLPLYNSLPLLESLAAHVNVESTEIHQ